MGRKMADYKNEAIDSLRRLKKAPGMIAKLARDLEISRAAIYGWKVVPADRVLQIEHYTAIPRHELRPDLYVPTHRLSRALRESAGA